MRLSTSICAAFVVAAAMLSSVPAWAQRLEAGGHATRFNSALLDEARWGGGARLGVQLAPLVIAEGEVNVVPGGNALTGAMTQGFAGLKIGGRGERFGLFAKARPGVVRFGNDFLAPGVVCVAVFPPPETCLAARTHLAFDLGSVVEFYPTSRTILRLDAGTTTIWYGRRGGDGRERQGNFQLSLGAGLRF